MHGFYKQVVAIGRCMVSTSRWLLQAVAGEYSYIFTKLCSEYGPVAGHSD